MKIALAKISALALLLGGVSTQAAEPTIAKSDKPWTNVTTLSFVATGGNAQGQTLGFGNDFLYKWVQSSLNIKAGAIRSTSTVVTRTATGTLDSYVINEARTTNTTADAYFLNGRYDYRFDQASPWYWFAGAGWERNRPAGLDSKESIAAGLGRIWFDNDITKFKTDAGLGFVHEQPVTKPRNFHENYVTFVAAAQLRHKLTPTSLYSMDLELLDNLRETRDYQAALRQGIAVNLNKALALKAGLDLVYRNQPLNFMVPLVGNPNVTVPVAAKKLDTIFTTSLVLTL